MEMDFTIDLVLAETVLDPVSLQTAGYLVASRTVQSELVMDLAADRLVTEDLTIRQYHSAVNLGPAFMPTSPRIAKTEAIRPIAKM